MTFDPNIYMTGAAFVALSLGGVAVMWADRNERQAKAAQERKDKC